MPRFHNINGERVQFTADEETARDAGVQFYAAVGNLALGIIKLYGIS